MASLDYDKEIINKWNKMVSKRKDTIKTRSSRPQLTNVQIREDVEVFRMLNKVNLNICLQCYGGANTSVTNDVSILHYVQNIPEYLFRGVEDSIKCTKKVYSTYNAAIIT